MKFKMSDFNGHFYQRDVGLIDQALDVLPEAFTPDNHSDSFLVFTDINGSLENVEVLDVNIHGVGLNNDGDKFIVTNGTTVGYYAIKAKLNYKNADSQEVKERVYTINLPIPKENYVSQLEIDLIKHMDVLRFGPLPRVAATNITPTDKADEFKFTIEAKLTAFMLSSYINEAVVNGGVLSFNKSFHTLEKSGNETVVQIRYNSVANKNKNSAIALSYSNGSQPNYVKSIEYIRVSSVAVAGEVVEGAKTKFVINTSKGIDITGNVIATVINSESNDTRIMSNNCVIHVEDGVIPSTLDVKDYDSTAGTFTLNLDNDCLYQGAMQLKIGEQSDIIYTISIYSPAYNGFKFKKGFPLKFVKDVSGGVEYWVASFEYADMEKTTSDGDEIFVYEPVMPLSQFKIDYVPASSGDKIAAMLEARYKEVQVEGSVAGSSITVTNFNVVCSDYRYITGDNEDVRGNDDKVLVMGIVGNDNTNKFNIVGDDYAFTLSFDEDKEIEVNNDDGNSFKEGSKILIPAGVKLPFKKFENKKYRLSADESLMYEKNEVVRDGMKSWTVNDEINDSDTINFRYVGYSNGFKALGNSEDKEKVYSFSDPLQTGTTLYAGIGFTLSGDRQVYYNGTYRVAVGNNGAIVFMNGSDPSGTWSAITTTGTRNNLRSVYYNGTYWVAVGDGGAIVCHDGSYPNGTWSAITTTGTRNILHSVFYDDTYWVAVGNNGTIVYHNGPNPNVTWIAITNTGTGNGLHSVFCGSGTYWVAVGNNGTIVFRTSSDPNGVWSVISSTEISNNLYSVYSNGYYWVAVGEEGTIVYHVGSSPNGTWSVISSTEISNNLYSVRYIHDYWVAVGDEGTIVYHNGSDPRGTWSKYDPKSSFTIKLSMNSLLLYPTTVNDYYITVGNNGITAHCSANNTSVWNRQYIGPRDPITTWNSICSNTGNGDVKYVAVGNGCKVAYSTSDDGSSWSLGTVESSDSNINWNSVCNDGQNYYVCGSSGYYTSSSDGQSWIAPSRPAGNLSLYSIYSNRTTIIMAGAGSHINSSSDGGANWTYEQVPQSSAHSWLSICPVDENYALVGSNGQFTYGKPNNWRTTTIAGDTSITWKSIHYDNSTLIAVSRQNKVAYSYDLGQTWAIETIDNSNASSAWNSITYDTTNKRFITVGNDGVFAYHNWVPPTPTNPIIPLYFKGLNYNENIGFRALDKSTTVSINPAFTVYEDKLASGTLLDFTSDAGFVIPIIDNGRFDHKYIRISDLYNEIIALQSKESNSVVDLADRLHACEVALEDTCSSTLEDAAQDSEADRLYNVKNKWCVVDTYGMD